MSKLLKRFSQSSKKSQPSSSSDANPNAAPSSTPSAPAPSAPATATSTAPAPAPAAAATAPTSATATTMSAKIAVLIYSLYGHQVALAKEVEKGLRSAGADVTVFQIPEILREDVLAKMHANKSWAEGLPAITGDKLAEFDGFILSAGVRYGRQPAAVSAFFDTTGKQWGTGALVGKFAGLTTSTASQHGGAESLAITTLPFLAHQGIIFVPIGFANPESSTLDEIHGSSAYGAATVTGGDGSRQPTEKDLKVANSQGVAFAKIVNQYVRGKSA